MLAGVLAELAPILPAPLEGIRFPGEGAVAFKLRGKWLVLSYRPPSPWLSLEARVDGAGPITPFQRGLAARIAGELRAAEQLKLDRVIRFDFSGQAGFVETEPVQLWFEATGRNANLILTDPGGKILLLDRPVKPQQNRYRTLLPGGIYQTPPPYTKLDPRSLNSPAELAPLLGKPLGQALISQVDGIGPQITRVILQETRLEAAQNTTQENLHQLFPVLQHYAHHPQELVPSVRALSPEPADQLTDLRQRALAALQHQKTTLEHRLEDQRRHQQGAEEAEQLQKQADLLLAYSYQIPRGAQAAELTDFEGSSVNISLAGQPPAQVAQQLYNRAKRLLLRAQAAPERIKNLTTELEALQAEIEALANARPAELRARLKEPAQAARAGLSFVSADGFTVLVGRNAKENEFLTRAAKSEDLWFHIQGLPGSHVIVKTEGKTPPLSTLLFAAELAAYFSKAQKEKNVAVDYTKKKYVSRPRKAAPGQVIYTQAKTLFVDPALPAGNEGLSLIR